MTVQDVKPFFEQNHQGVVITCRNNGAVQASAVASGVLGNPVISTRRLGQGRQPEKGPRLHRDDH